MREAQLRDLIDRYFAGRLDNADARAMFNALGNAPAMKSYFEAKQAWATLDPNAISFDLRMSRLRLNPRRVWSWFATPASILTAVALFFVEPQTPPEAFFTHGAESSFWASAYTNGSEHLELGDDASVHDDLTFTYQTEEPGYLAIFAVDEDDHVYWYEPARLDEKAVPQLARVAPSDTPVKLTRPVRHAFTPGRVRFFAVLVDAPLTVAQIEAALPERALHETELRFAKQGWTRTVELR